MHIYVKPNMNRTPSGNEDMFVNDLGLYLNQTKQDAYSQILVGDMNIKINTNSNVVHDYLNLLSEHNYVSMINQLTRIHGVTGSCIDHIFLKCDKYNMHHECLSMKSLRNIHYLNYKGLKRDLTSYDWSSFYNETNVEILTETFINQLKKLISKNTFTKKISRASIKRKQWITSGIVKSVNEKNRLHAAYKLDSENEEKKTIYNNYKVRLNKIIREAKYSYYKREIDLNNGSPKQLWKLIKNICVENNKKVPRQVIDKNNVVCNTPETISEAFNVHFVSIGEAYAKNIIRPNTPPPISQINQKNIFLNPITPSEVINIISSLKNRKVPGYDNIQGEVYKKVSEELALPLCHLINRTFLTSTVPNQIKIAIVTPIYKKGDDKDLNNYRPISSITTLAKIFEKALKKRLVDFLEKNNCISAQQFGFREGLSTNDAITKLTGEIANSLEKSKPTMCVFLDLAKAFDTVSHRQMLEVLSDAGIRGSTNQLFENYLSNRKQAVKINSVTSKEKTFNYGLPQGTVLGPLLFILYINSIITSSTSSCGQLLSFADDTVILYSADTWEMLKDNVQKDLVNIFNYFSHKLLTINYDKTFFVPFSNTARCMPKFHQITVKDEIKCITIRSKCSHKYLGITIDCHLRWDIHINNVVKTLRQLLYRFKYLKNILDLSHLKTIYYSLVESRLRYAIIGWGGAAYCHLRPLDVLQKKMLKIIYNKKITYPSDLLFSETGILDVRQLYVHQIILYCFKNRNTRRVF
nr:unnamed protein product [Callosobruchus analis]